MLFMRPRSGSYGCMLDRPLALGTFATIYGEGRLARKKRSVDLTQISEWDDGKVRRKEDYLAAEEPLEIRVGDEPLSVTMRTPGHDLELAAGFLFTEGLVQQRSQIVALEDDFPDEEKNRGNVVRAELAPESTPDFEKMRRHFFATSSCGICGKASIDSVRARTLAPPNPSFILDAEVLVRLPDTLRASQAVFGRTGGLHAAALFSATGELLVLREDIGRHNAVDKVIGWALLENRVPLSENVMLVSGRGGFEIVQKAIVAGAPVVASVSAPSSLAVQLARELRLTLIGFLRGRRFVIYSGEERVAKTVSMKRTLPPEALQEVNTRLEQAHKAFQRRYPGPSAERQPVHVVYGGAHLFRAGTAKRFGELALQSLDEYAPNFAAFAKAVSLPEATGLPDSAEAVEAIAKSIEVDPETARRENRPAWFAHTVYRRVREKLQREPVEDFRIDFEDGYGNRPDEEEDGHAAAAADEVSAGMNAGELPPFLGIRIKPLTEELRARSIRTLDIFLTQLASKSRGELPKHFCVTLPKVTLPDEVAALTDICSRLEPMLDFEPGVTAHRTDDRDAASDFQ